MYPDPQQNPPRHARTTVSDIDSRLARLERTLTAISNEKASQERNSQSILGKHIADDPLPPAVNHEEAWVDRKGTLIQHGESSVYFNEVLITNLLEEEREIRSNILTLKAEGVQPESPYSNISGIYSDSCSCSVDMQDLLPAKWEATQLWQAFLMNVNPVVKILHAPTVQKVVFAAINDPSMLKSDTSCLIFAIYFAATSSLGSDEAIHILGQEKEISLNNFRRGLEQSLRRAKILIQPTITSLQALGLYLTSLRAYNDSRSVWTLNGLAIRAAQSIGLHRDGASLKLRPFEAEMRRRLWWHIWALDIRAAEDHGLSENIIELSTGIRFPMNMDDSELSETMQEPPSPQPRWSEATFSLIIVETSYTVRRLHKIRQSCISPAECELKRKEIITNLKNTIEELYLCHCDLNIPIQRATSMLARILVAKIDFATEQQWQSLAGLEQQATEEKLIRACEILEMSIQILEDDLLRGFRWVMGSYQQYYVLTYAIWHLCSKPHGPTVERAWKVVDNSLQLGASKACSSERGSKWTILELLREKAKKIREQSTEESLAPVSIQMEDYNMDSIDPGQVPAIYEDFMSEIGWNRVEMEFPGGWEDLLVNGIGTQGYGL